MCKMVSMVLTKDKTHYLPDSDLHANIIEKFGLPDHLNARGCPLLLCVEVYPDDYDWTKPFTEWDIHLEQSVVPEWYNPDDVEKRVMRALEKWYEQCVIPKNNCIEELNSDRYRICLGKISVMRECSRLDVAAGEARISRMEGNSCIICAGDKTVIGKMKDESRIYKGAGNACIEYLEDNAYIRYLEDNASVVEMCNSAGIGNAGDYSRVMSMRQTSYVLTLTRYARIDAMRDYSVVNSISEYNEIGLMCDYSIVKHSNGTIKCMKDHAVIHSMSETAVVEQMMHSAAVLNAHPNAVVEAVKDNAFVRRAQYAL